MMQDLRCLTAPGTVVAIEVNLPGR